MSKRDIAVGMIGNRQLALIADAQNLACPHCGDIEEVSYIRQGIWLCCKTHKVKWFAGWDFSLPDQVTEEQRRRYHEIGMHEFEHIYREVAEGQ